MKPPKMSDAISDSLALIGTGLIGYGLWLRWPWLACVVVGTLLLAAGVFPYLRPRDAA